MMKIVEGQTKSEWLQFGVHIQESVVQGESFSGKKTTYVFPKSFQKYYPQKID